jgi:ABC-type nitrate/sulfonate/bicarbonate transport system substrate-binding protein
MNRFFGFAIACFVLSIACAPAAQQPAATTSPGKPAATGQVQTIRLAVSQTDSNFYSPIYIAQKEGFFKEQGIELTVQPVNPPTATQALIANQFDIAHAASPGISAALQGAPVKMIYVMAERAPYWVITKPEIKTWADLKGKKLGVSSTTGTQVLDTTRLLKLHGVDAQADGVQYVVPGGPGDADKYAGIKSGTIDAGLFTGLGGVQALSDGFTMIGDFSQIRTLDYTIWTTDSFIQSKPDLVQGFITATLKGVQIYKNNPERALAATTEQFEGDQASAKKLSELSANWFDDDGIISDAALEEGVQYKREAAEKPSNLTGAQLINMDFVKKANEELKRTNFKP